MRLSRKKIVNCILLLVGMLLCHNICFQQSDSSRLIELSAEDASTSNCSDVDYEINEEDSVTFSVEFLSMVENSSTNNHFHFNSRSARPFFPVWQPPKLS